MRIVPLLEVDLAILQLGLKSGLEIKAHEDWYALEALTKALTVFDGSGTLGWPKASAH